MATMNQKSSIRENPQSVSRVLTADIDQDAVERQTGTGANSAESIDIVTAIPWSEPENYRANRGHCGTADIRGLKVRLNAQH